MLDMPNLIYTYICKTKEWFPDIQVGKMKKGKANFLYSKFDRLFDVLCLNKGKHIISFHKRTGICGQYHTRGERCICSL